jgi:hypothetical protein
MRYDPEAAAILNDRRKFCPRCEAVMVLRTANKGGDILGLNHLPGGFLIGGLEAGAFLGNGIDAIESPAANSPAHEAETCFHVRHATAVEIGP